MKKRNTAVKGIPLIIQPLYFNEVCFTCAICFVTQCKCLSISGWDKWLWSRWGWQSCGLVDASQAGHAGKAVVTHGLCHSGQAKALLPSQHSSEGCRSEGSEGASRRSHEWEHSYRSFIYGDIKYATIIPQHQSNKHHCSIWSGISKHASHIHRERQNAELFMLWLWTNIEKISEFGTMQQSRFRADYCTSFNQNRTLSLL